MDEKRIPQRSEVPEEYTWDLSDLFENDEAWQAAYEKAARFVELSASYCGKLGESAETLLSYLQMSDEAGLELEALAGYAMRHADEDTSNSHYLNMRGMFMQLYVQIAGANA